MIKEAFVFHARNLISRKKGGQGGRRHIHRVLLIQSELLSRLGLLAKQAGSLSHTALSPHSVGCCRGLDCAWALRLQRRWSQMKHRICGVCQGKPRAQVVVWGKQYI